MARRLATLTADALRQVLLYENFTNGSGPNGYDFFFGFLFPFNDSRFSVDGGYSMSCP